MDDVHPVQRRCPGRLAQDVQQRPVHERRQCLRAGRDLLGEPRRAVQQLGRHAGPLGTLTGKDEHDLPRGVGGSPRQVRRGLAAGQRAETGKELRPVTADDDGPFLEGRAGRRQRVGDIGRDEFAVLLNECGQPSRLGPKRFGCPSRDQPRQGRRRGRHRAGYRFWCFDRRGLLQDDVRVRAADPEGGHSGSPRPAGPRPRPRVGQHLYGAG